MAPESIDVKCDRTTLMGCSNSPKPWVEFTSRRRCLLLSSHLRLQQSVGPRGSVSYKTTSQIVPYHLSYPTDHDGPSSVPGCMEIHQSPFRHHPAPILLPCTSSLFPVLLTLGPQLHAGIFFPHPDTRHFLRLFTDGPQHLPSPIFPDVP